MAITDRTRCKAFQNLFVFSEGGASQYCFLEDIERLQAKLLITLIMLSLTDLIKVFLPVFTQPHFERGAEPTKHRLSLKDLRSEWRVTFSPRISPSNMPERKGFNTSSDITFLAERSKQVESEAIVIAEFSDIYFSFPSLCRFGRLYKRKTTLPTFGSVIVTSPSGRPVNCFARTSLRSSSVPSSFLNFKLRTTLLRRMTVLKRSVMASMRALIDVIREMNLSAENCLIVTLVRRHHADCFPFLPFIPS